MQNDLACRSSLGIKYFKIAKNNELPKRRGTGK